MRTTVGYSLNIIVKKKKTLGNRYLVILSIGLYIEFIQAPASWPIYGTTVKGFAPRSHFKSRFDRILIKNYHAMCSL